ncbi:MAG: PIN domain-containing protein [Victivallaceae bacterium]|nr:PIN domain-containing protein [Victivallaceae bacterium]
MTQPKNLNALLFVDTNIFLDFYRTREGKLNLELLEKLQVHQDRLIMTPQVEMEYKKNRQNVILLDFLKLFSKPPQLSIIPPIVGNTQIDKAITSTQVKNKSAYNRVKEKVKKY